MKETIAQAMQKNEEIRNDIWRSVNHLSDAQLNEHPAEDKWSIMQILNHLYLMECSLVKSMKMTMENETLQPTDEKPIHLTIERNFKVDAPSFVIPSEERMTLVQMKEKLAHSRQTLTEFAAQVCEEEALQKSFPHPVFGAITVKQWIAFIGYHEQRHLYQIEEYKGMIL